MQSLADRLLSAQASQGVADSAHADSLGDVGLRMQSADALRKVSIAKSSQSTWNSETGTSINSMMS